MEKKDEYTLIQHCTFCEETQFVFLTPERTGCINVRGDIICMDCYKKHRSKEYAEYIKKCEEIKNG